MWRAARSWPRISGALILVLLPLVLLLLPLLLLPPLLPVSKRRPPRKAAKEARVAKAMDPAHQATKDEMVSNIDRAKEDGAQFEMDKKMRKLTRALDDVKALKAKRDAGNMLAAFEVKKVAKEAEFREEMRALETAMAVLCGPPLPLLERPCRDSNALVRTMLKANLIHGASTTPRTLRQLWAHLCSRGAWA